VEGEAFSHNHLPIATLARTGWSCPWRAAPVTGRGPFGIPDWERWNDYGIGLCWWPARPASRRSCARRQAPSPRWSASAARTDPQPGPGPLPGGGPGRGRGGPGAGRPGRPPAPPWTLAWYSALVKRELGDLDGAIADLEALAETRFPEARERGFDFSKDYRMLTELGRTLYERARQERGEARRPARAELLSQAPERLSQALVVDPEYAPAHYQLGLILADLGDSAGAEHHRGLHDLYRADDNIAERAITRHRAENPAANHAAETVAIYDLQRIGAYELMESSAPDHLAETRRDDRLLR
jgi:tetratricopeptide (TPR) repeat protein